MLRFLALCLLICFPALAAAAQGKPPTFSQYSVKVEKARIQAIDFKKNPDARTYKTRLIHGLEGGVNFAGHYIIVGWGCGTGCTNAAVIDTFTGNIYWPEEFYNVDATYADNYSDVQIDFKKGSRMMIIHGRPGTKDENGRNIPPGDHYFEWKNNKFRSIMTVPLAQGN
jgi:hypothetical protein